MCYSQVKVQQKYELDSVYPCLFVTCQIAMDVLFREWGIEENNERSQYRQPRFDLVIFRIQIGIVIVWDNFRCSFFIITVLFISSFVPPLFLRLFPTCSVRFLTCITYFSITLFSLSFICFVLCVSPLPLQSVRNNPNFI